MEYVQNPGKAEKKKKKKKKKKKARSGDNRLSANFQVLWKSVVTRPKGLVTTGCH